MAVIVPILSTFNDKGIKSAVREFKTAKTQIQKFGAVGKIFEGVGRSLTKNLTLPLAAAAAGIYKATQAASTLEESLSKTNAVFGSNASAIIEWSKTSATAFGSSQQQALEAVSTYGNLFQAFGLTRDQASEFSTTIVQLAGDLSSFNNVPIEDVFTALRSGLSGETEPLKRFGVALNDQRLRAEAAALGLGEYTGQLPIAIKSQAAYSLILKDTTLAQGDYLRTSNSLANQQRTLQAEVTDLVAEFGTAFLPIMKSIVRVVREQIVPQLQRFSNFVKGLDKNTIELVVKIGALLAVFGPMLIFIGKLIAATSTFYKVFLVLGSAIKAHPIIFLATVIGTLVVAFITAYKTSETFRAKVNGALNAVITVVENLANAFITLYNGVILPVFNKILGALQKINPEIELAGEVGEVAFKRLGTSTKALTQDIDSMSDYALALAGIGRGTLTPEIENMGDAMAGSTGNGGAKDKADKLKKALQELRQAAVDAAQKVVNDLNDSLRSAESQLDSAKSKFNDFKKAISGTVTGILNFGKAADESDFLEGLMKQAADATTFADKVKRLIQLGLSERGIQQVLDAGFEAGTRIADELIAGGQTVVEQVNQLLSSVASVAEQVGDMGAREFYLAGVTQGEALVNGILTALRAAQDELIRAQSALSTGGAIANVGGTLQQSLRQEAISSGNQRALDLINKVTQGGTGKVSAGELDRIQRLGVGKGLVHPKNRLAKGGIVLGPTNALIGEAGPEAVVPLSGANSARGGMGATYNITINAGVGTDGAVVGRQIVEAIKKFERSSGQVFARA